MSRRTQAQWRDLISQQQSSGVSAAQFCRERSINPNYFSARKKQCETQLTRLYELLHQFCLAPLVRQSNCESLSWKCPARLCSILCRCFWNAENDEVVQ